MPTRLVPVAAALSRGCEISKTDFVKMDARVSQLNPSAFARAEALGLAPMPKTAVSRFGEVANALSKNVSDALPAVSAALVGAGMLAIPDAAQAAETCVEVVANAASFMLTTTILSGVLGVATFAGIVCSGVKLSDTTLGKPIAAYCRFFLEQDLKNIYQVWQFFKVSQTKLFFKKDVSPEIREFVLMVMNETNDDLRCEMAFKYVREHAEKISVDEMQAIQKAVRHHLDSTSYFTGAYERPDQALIYYFNAHPELSRDEKIGLAHAAWKARNRQVMYEKIEFKAPR